MDCLELWCLASMNGEECKETFDTYDDFEEHFCQKHLDLALFACGAKGCTAQFGTLLQIFRHMTICKRQDKKIRFLQCPPNVLESLTALDQAKLLAVQCCVKRAKRVTTEANDSTIIEQGGTTNDGVGLHSSLGDDQVHVPITEPPGIHQVEDAISNVESESNCSRKGRAVTPARQAARRLREQMLLEKKMKQDEKPPEKVGRGAQMKRKKLPVKITDKTRFSALIIDDPKKTTGSNNPQTVESGVSRDSSLGTMNSDTPFESTVYVGSAENRPGLPYSKIQNPVLAPQKRPRVFESSLPAGPILPPKNHDASCRQPLGPANSRPPDYSEFSRNPAKNPMHREVSLPPLSVMPSQRMSDQASNGCQNFQGGRTRRSSSVVSQPVISSPKTNIQQNHSAMELHDMLRTKFLQKNQEVQNSKQTAEQTDEVDLDIISLFSKKAKESKEWNSSSEHLKELQEEHLKEPARKQSRPAEPVELNVVPKEEAVPMEMSEKSAEDTIINLSSDKDNSGEEGDQDDEAVPILLNLFSDKDAAEPMLFDPRVKPTVDLCASDKSRNDWRNTEDEVVQEKSVEICRDSDGSRVSSGIEKKWKRHRHHHYHLRTPRSYTRGTRSRKSRQRRSRSRKSYARRCCCSRLRSRSRS